MTRDEAEAIARKYMRSGDTFAPAWADVACADAILEAVESTRQKHAALCREIQEDNGPRLGLGFRCARAILGESETP